MSEFRLHNGDCIEVMSRMLENSVDAIVTDPPYELGFMGKSWDSTGIAFNTQVWKEALRVLKPGGHLIAFSGSRTYHRMAVAIEDAGFEIRDQIMWIYGSGFPKSLNIAKALDKTLGVESEIVGYHQNPAKSIYTQGEDELSKKVPLLLPTSNEGKQWQGWGTALKPAHEPMVLARKPVEGTIANNVLTYGVGGLNIDGTRVGNKRDSEQKQGSYSGSEVAIAGKRTGGKIYPENLGRWPANVIHDGIETEWSRFFYCAKASKRDRNEGLDGFEAKRDHDGRKEGNKRGSNPRNRTNDKKINHHPTVKPTDLMRYLCRLITPPNGIVLDPFMGSGSTGKAAIYENFNFIGIEQSAEYMEIAKARIEFALGDK